MLCFRGGPPKPPPPGADLHGPQLASPKQQMELCMFNSLHLHPAAVRCDMVVHQAFRSRRVRKTGIGGEVRHGVTSGVSRETSSNKHVTSQFHRDHRPIPPIRITRIHCTICLPRVGWTGHLLFDRSCCKIFQGCGPLGRKSCDANWMYPLETCETTHHMVSSRTDHLDFGGSDPCIF